MAKAKDTKTEVIVLFDYTQDDIAPAIGRIAELNREKDSLESKANEKINAIQEALSADLKPLLDEIKKISLSVKQYVDKNRTKLFLDDAKTVKLETGDIAYRSGKPSVATNSTEKVINEILDRNDLTDVKTKFDKKMAKVYLRTKLELNKDAILENPDEAFEKTGVGIKEGAERFYIKPYATNTEMEVVA